MSLMVVSNVALGCCQPAGVLSLHQRGGGPGTNSCTSSTRELELPRLISFLWLLAGCCDGPLVSSVSAHCVHLLCRVVEAWRSTPCAHKPFSSSAVELLNGSAHYIIPHLCYPTSLLPPPPLLPSWTSAPLCT